MKYKLIPENREVKNNSTAQKFPFSFGKTVSAITNASPTPNSNDKKVAFGCCSLVIIIPSLFAKVSFFIKRVLFARTIVNGIRIIVDHIITVAAVIKPSPDLTNAAEAIPKLIPNQNTKFQNLSLVSHFGCFALIKLLGKIFLSVKSCIERSHIWFGLYANIIPKIESINKQFIAVWIVMAVLLPHNAVYAIDDVSSRNTILKLIQEAENKHHIPSGLLLAVVRTESNMNPFALNISGKSLFLKTKSEAIQAINQAILSGIANIDIGLAQINYRWHRSKFSSIESMLSVNENISYAAGYLSNLKRVHGDWHKALRYYHSAKPKHHKGYSRKVVACWLDI